jgi:hypothetical protein
LRAARLAYRVILIWFFIIGHRSCLAPLTR